jgi:hypothetical protein
MKWKENHFVPECRFLPEKEDNEKINVWGSLINTVPLSEVKSTLQRNFEKIIFNKQCRICGEKATLLCFNCHRTVCEEHGTLYTFRMGFFELEGKGIFIALVCRECVEDNKDEFLAFGLDLDFPFERRFHIWKLRYKREIEDVKRVIGAHIVDGKKDVKDLVHDVLAGNTEKFKCVVCGEDVFAPAGSEKAVHRQCFDRVLKGLDEDSKAVIASGKVRFVR